MNNFLLVSIIFMIILCLLIILLIITVFTFIICGSFDEIQGENQDNATVIVPGCKIHGDRVGKTLQHRLDTAYLYLCSHKKSMCIVCGGQYGKYTQAQIMKNYLVSKGIAETRILLDDTSKTTFENMKNANDIIEKANITNKNVIISTQLYHLYRSKFYAKKFGLEPKSIKANTPMSQIWFAYPREVSAILKAWLKGR